MASTGSTDCLNLVLGAGQASHDEVAAAAVPASLPSPETTNDADDDFQEVNEVESVDTAPHKTAQTKEPEAAAEASPATRLSRSESNPTRAKGPGVAALLNRFQTPPTPSRSSVATTASSSRPGSAATTPVKASKVSADTPLAAPSRASVEATSIPLPASEAASTDETPSSSTSSDAFQSSQNDDDSVDTSLAQDLDDVDFKMSPTATTQDGSRRRRLSIPQLPQSVQASADSSMAEGIESSYEPTTAIQGASGVLQVPQGGQASPDSPLAGGFEAELEPSTATEEGLQRPQSSSLQLPRSAQESVDSSMAQGFEASYEPSIEREVALEEPSSSLQRPPAQNNQESADSPLAQGIEEELPEELTPMQDPKHGSVDVPSQSSTVEEALKISQDSPTLSKDSIPPSQGAVSLIDPAATIQNPFRTSDPSSSESSATGSNGGKVEHALPVLSHTEKMDDLSQELSWQTTEAPAGISSPALGDAMGSPDPSRFSRVSLSSAVDVGNATDKRATMATPFGRLQAEALDKRVSADGMEKLRKDFEKLQQRHTHSRQQSDATNAEQEDDSRADHSGNVAAVHDENGVNWDFWGKVMSNYHEVARESPEELSRAIQAGIPAQLRGLCWQLLSASKDEEMEIIYAYYIRQTSSHEKQIRKDLSRTFPEQTYFQNVNGIGQENLFNVVKAYSLYDEECGYCQGMQFIVGPLLLNMPDEEAFSTLVRLMKSYGLRGHFVPNMPGLQLRLFQFDRLLEDLLPLLHRHLTRIGVKPSMYASQWIMCLCSYRFPLPFVYRVLDSVFAEGIEAVFRFAMALMHRNEEVLLEKNFEQAVAFLKGTDVCEAYREQKAESSTETAGEDADETVTSPATEETDYNVSLFSQDAYNVQITTFMLDGYAAEFEEQVKAANAHRREVEALRLVNRNLAAKVTSLESQITQMSEEHVGLVKDAVLSKVAKEEMEAELIRCKMALAEASANRDREEFRGSRQVSGQTSPTEEVSATTTSATATTAAAAPATPAKTTSTGSVMSRFTYGLAGLRGSSG